MTPISDMDLYVGGMAKSMLDKLFFVDKISDIGSIVDYGCADGTLIKSCMSMMPEVTYMGYDICGEMLEIARANVPDGSRVQFTDNWGDCINLNTKPKVLVLSSVIHEVYSYGDSECIEGFWNRVFKSDFDYIVIRDLIPSLSISRPTAPNDYLKLIRSKNSVLIRKFESVWGSLESNKNLMHFLMKYRYVENFDRECRENYFPIHKEELLRKIPAKYDIMYQEHYVLPFVKNEVRKDFGIDIIDNTHFKLILERSE